MQHARADQSFQLCRCAAGGQIFVGLATGTRSFSNRKSGQRPASWHRRKATVRHRYRCRFRTESARCARKLTLIARRQDVVPVKARQPGDGTSQDEPIAGSAAISRLPPVPLQRHHLLAYRVRAVPRAADVTGPHKLGRRVSTTEGASSTRLELTDRQDDVSSSRRFDAWRRRFRSSKTARWLPFVMFSWRASLPPKASNAFG